MNAHVDTTLTFLNLSRRLLAACLDLSGYLIFYLVGITILCLVHVMKLESILNTAFFILVVIGWFFTWAIVQAKLLSTIGNTPGNKLTGITIRNPSGGTLTFIECVQHNLASLLPQLIIFTLMQMDFLIGSALLVAFYCVCLMKGKVIWDSKQYSVHYIPMSYLKIIIHTLLVLIYFACAYSIISFLVFAIPFIAVPGP